MREIATAPQPVFASEALRVVAAQVALQGHRMAGLEARTVDDRCYRVREMVPAENRASLDHLQDDPARLQKAVEVLGGLTAWSHLRGSRFGVGDTVAAELSAWAAGPALDAVLAAAARATARTNAEFAAFRRDVHAGHVTPKAEVVA